MCKYLYACWLHMVLVPNTVAVTVTVEGGQARHSWVSWQTAEGSLVTESALVHACSTCLLLWCAGISDWEAAAAAHAAKAAKRRFNASSGHKEQVMSQVANLHRMAATAQDAGGLW
jgi:hypothetical protein